MLCLVYLCATSSPCYALFGLRATNSCPVAHFIVALTMHANTCDSARMASQLVDSCDRAGDTPSWPCCQLASAVVERSCLCLVSEEEQVRTSASLGRGEILYLYKLCGNTKQVGEDDCGPISPPPPPAQEVLVPPPPVEHRGKHQHRLAIILGFSIGGGLLTLLSSYISPSSHIHKFEKPVISSMIMKLLSL